ncbi:MAG: hypothetical protein RIS76_1525 [Verrucomicrobiota bacterium]
MTRDFSSPFWQRMFWAFLGGVAASAVVTAAVAEGGLALMVPAYFYPKPGGDWERLTAAARRVPLVAILNPNSGPGSATVADPEYVRAVQSLRQAGGRVTGYVSTRYAQRPIAEVNADVRRYHELYPLDGFFLDEMSNDGRAVSVNYYAEVCEEIRRLKPAYHVTGNPGTHTQERYLSRPTVDTLVTFEEGTGYPGYTPDTWNRRYPAHRFCHLLHSVVDAPALTNAVALARKRNAGFLFVTDDLLPNPWDRLPVFWDNEVNLIESANRAAAESVPPRVDLRRRADGLGRLQLDGSAGRYIVARGPSLSEWLPLVTNLTFTGQMVFEPILWSAAPEVYFRAAVE